MRILVTGGAGYIGSHAAKLLAACGHDPVVLDNLSTGHRWAVQWGPLVEGDIGDAELVRRTLLHHHIEVVMHFAAHAYVGESMTDPKKYFGNNVVKTLTLLDAMIQAGVPRLVFSSTCATYGVPEQDLLDESHPQRPINPYGESKLFVERALQWYGIAYGLKWMALRYFNAAGADEGLEIGESHEPETHLIPLVLQAAGGERENVTIFGHDYPTCDGTAVRDYIHVTDLARAHERAAEHLMRGGESLALNLGTGHGYSVRQVVETAEHVTGHKIPVQTSSRRQGDPPVLVARARKAAEILGWSPACSGLDNILQTAWNWYCRQRPGSSYCGQRQETTGPWLSIG